MPPFEQPAVERGIEVACTRMHDRLICWGQLTLSGGNGPREKWDSDDQFNCREYDAHDYDDARSLNIKVIQLPKKQQSLALAAFYGTPSICLCWHEYSDSRRASLSEGLAEQVNKGLRRINAEMRTDWMPIRAQDFDAIRLRAIQQLVNREREGQAR